MTAKEKAKELVLKFGEHTVQESWQSKNYFAIECALIAVDELIEEISKWAGGDFQEWEKERWKYLQEVKQEIEKL